MFSILAYLLLSILAYQLLSILADLLLSILVIGISKMMNYELLALPLPKVESIIHHS